jgi:histidinol-phosphate aminotransferase
MRRTIVRETRHDTIDWLRASGHDVIGASQTNHFLVDTGRNGASVIAAMKAQNVYIGPTWAIWPKAVRVTVGTPEEMIKFRTAFKAVMDAPPTAA